MWPRGEIILEKDKLEAYPSGSVVRGKLVVNAATPLPAKHHIKISVKGWANVNIKKILTWNQNTTYSNSKMYLDLSFFVWKGECGGKEQDLAVGIHEFPFEFQLPEDMPSSYSGKYGSIKYIVSSQIQTKKKITQFGQILALQVQRNTDLSEYPPLRYPKHYKSEKIKGGLFQSSGEISFTVDLSANCLCVGDTIPLSGSITNTSSSRVSLKAYLVQRVQFTGIGRFLWIVESMQEETKNTLAMVDIGDFSEGKKGAHTQDWSCDKLQCPDKILQSDSTEPCDFISVSYYIRIMMTGSGPTVDSTFIDIPVSIGNQLSPKQRHSAASKSHTKAAGGDSIVGGACITPSVTTFGHGATPSAPPLRMVEQEATPSAPPLTTASNDVLKKRLGEKSNSTQSQRHDRYGHCHLQGGKGSVATEEQMLQSVDNLQQPGPPSYDELFPKGGPTNHS